MFPCTKCGLCCRNVNRSPVYKDLDKGDGVCRNLTSENNCNVYNDRPLMCRIDDAYKLIFWKEMSLPKYYELNLNACYDLQVAAGICEEKRIDKLNFLVE